MTPTPTSTHRDTYCDCNPPSDGVANADQGEEKEAHSHDAPYGHSGSYGDYCSNRHSRAYGYTGAYGYIGANRDN